MLSRLTEVESVSCDGGKAIGICGCRTLEDAISRKTSATQAGVKWVGVAAGSGGCWTLEELVFVRVAAVGSGEFGAVGVSIYALSAVGPASSLLELSSHLTSGGDNREKSEEGVKVAGIKDTGWSADIWV
jgi:hypothetical protein